MNQPVLINYLIGKNAWQTSNVKSQQHSFCFTAQVPIKS